MTGQGTWQIALRLAGQAHHALGIRRRPPVSGEEQLEDRIYHLFSAFAWPSGAAWDPEREGPGETPRLARMAAKAAEFLPAWPAELWPALDRLLRRAWRDFPAIDVAHLPPFDFSGHRDLGYLAELAPAGSDRVPALMLVACHENGFAREKALRELAAAPDAAALPVLALRIDDWVAEVGSAALEAWQVSAPLATSEEMIGLLPLVHRMLAHRRAPAAAVRAPVEALLSRPEGQEALLAGLADRRPAVPQACWNALQWLPEPPDGWLEAALGSRDHRVRRPAAERLAAAGGAVPLERWFGQLIQDPDPAARHFALDLCARRRPEQLEALVRELLFDPSPEIRRRAQETLVMSFDSDPLQLYRSALAAPAAPEVHPGALRGLGETGEAADRAVLEAYLRDPKSRIRAAAVAGLARLAPRDEFEIFFRLLGDPAPKVVREARRALLSRTWPSPRLIAAQKEARSSVTRRAVARLARRVFNWDRVELLLLLAPEKDPAVQRIVRLIVESDVITARNFGRLAPKQRERLLELLAAASLPPDLGSQLGFLIMKAPDRPQTAEPI